MVIFLSADLMMASNASSYARQKGIAFSHVSSAKTAIEIITQNRPHLLLVDLQCPGLDIEGLGESLSALSDSMNPLSIAYAQHVDADKLESAKAAGFDQVLTRGQINSQMEQIIAGAG